MKTMRYFMILVSSALIGNTVLASEPETVEYVDLDRYLGKWYEIAAYPKWFQYGCKASEANYSFRDDGMLEVINSCRVHSVDGRWYSVKGKAKVVDNQSNAKLKVRFWFPAWGNYWIIDLDEDYQWAVVSDPKRKSLWILSRTRQMAPEILTPLLASLVERGYDMDRLKFTEHPLDDPPQE
jgi:apolipoprotein D and lipocalin family protein